MHDEALGDFALQVVDSFMKGAVQPRAQLELIISALGGGSPELRSAVEDAWARGNRAREAAGQPPLDPAAAFVSSRLPSAVAAQSAASSLGRGEGSREAWTDPPQEPRMDPASLVALVKERFSLDDASAARLNGGHRLDDRVLTELVASGIRSQRIVPRLLVPYLGPPGKFFEQFQEFLRMVAEPRDGNFSELMQHFGLYLLLNGTPQDKLAGLALAPPLESFVTDKIGRVRQIFYAGMLFGFTFTYVLFAQGFEINAKYREMDEAQRAKLRKLYEAEDRLALLVGNAGNVAMRRISDYGVEAREIQMALKKFLAARKRLISPADLFTEAKP
jgi:hypothetical protein